MTDTDLAYITRKAKEIMPLPVVDILVDYTSEHDTIGYYIRMDGEKVGRKGKWLEVAVILTDRNRQADDKRAIIDRKLNIAKQQAEASATPQT
jgi:hypothetical protein